MNDEEIKRINGKVSARKDTLVGRPAGPRLLIKIKSLDEKLGEDTKIVLPDDVYRAETFNVTIGVVVKMGLDCYNDVFQRSVGAKEPWCKVGDEVMFRSHASMFEDSKDGLVLINDQDVLWNFSKE